MRLIATMLCTSEACLRVKEVLIHESLEANLVDSFLVNERMASVTAKLIKII